MFAPLAETLGPQSSTSRRLTCNRFRPYRSEIDWCQLLAQIIAIHDDPTLSTTTNPADMARVIASMSRAICAHVETTQQRTADRVSAGCNWLKLGRELGFGDWEPVHDQKFLILQPLFRAVAIVVKPADYDVELQDTGQAPALIVLTGVQDGLSAPITFDSIVDKIGARYQAEGSVQAAETSLATAVRFAMDLEERELAAFGPSPDPAETCKDPGRSCMLSEGACRHSPTATAGTSIRHQRGRARLGLTSTSIGNGPGKDPGTRRRPRSGRHIVANSLRPLAEAKILISGLGWSEGSVEGSSSPREPAAGELARWRTG